MAKKKTLSAYDIALDAIRSPVRQIDETIRNWDALAGAELPNFNKGSRVVSMIAQMTPGQARDIAQAVLDAYAPRFQQCVVYPVTSAHTGRPLYTGFTFYEVAWSEPRGVVVRF